MITYTSVWNIILDKLAPGTNITALKHQDVEKALLDFTESQWLPGDIKEVDCTNQYITDNFDSNGIGKNERVGWAICNGYNNLTRNRTGRVSVAYGATALSGAQVFTSVGTSINAPVLGGSKDAVVVAHTHTATMSHNTNYNGGTIENPGRRVTSTSSGNGEIITATIGSTGVSGIGENMPPYIVTLFIQKL